VNTNDLTLGLALFDSARDPTNQPASSDRSDDGFDVGMLL